MSDIKLQPNVSGSGVTTISSANTNNSVIWTFPDTASNATIGYLSPPLSGSPITSPYTLATTDVGLTVVVEAGGAITVPDAVFSPGNKLTILNNSSTTVTLTMSITTAYLAGTNTDQASLSLATRGVANILFLSSTVCVVSGNVTGVAPPPPPPSTYLFSSTLHDQYRLTPNNIQISSTYDIYVLSDIYSSGSPPFFNQFRKAILCKFDSDANLVWYKQIDSLDNYAYQRGLAIDSVTGNIVVSSNSVNGVGSTTGYIYFDSSGAITNQTMIDNPGHSFGQVSIAFDGSGYLHSVGSSDEYSYGAAYIRLDPTGVLDFSASYASSGAMVDIAIENNNVFIAQIVDGNVSYKKLAVSKFTSSGTHVWTRQLDYGSDVDLNVNAIAVDSAENSYIASYFNDPSTSAVSLLLVAYDTSGVLLYQTKISDSNAYIRPTGIAISSSGVVVVEASVYNQSVAFAVGLFGFDASTGASLFQSVISPTSGYDNDVVSLTTRISSNALYAVGRQYGEVSSYNRAGIFLARLPLNNSLLGSYTIAGVTYAYTALSYTQTATSWIGSALTPTFNPLTLTQSSLSATTSVPTLATASVTL